MLKRSTVNLLDILHAHVTPDVCGATCLTCGRVVQKEEMVETHKYGCKVLVTCHGQEELRSFDFGTEYWGDQDLKRAMQRMRWFDPTKPNEDAYSGLTDEQFNVELGKEIYDV